MSGNQEYCTYCKASDKDIDCDTCDIAPPELMEANVLAWDIFQLCQTQWRMGPTGPAGLDYNVIIRVLTLWNGEREDLYKISIIEGEYLKHIQKNHGNGT